MKIILTIFCFLLISACSSTRHQIKPKFFYNGKSYDKAIINQNPNYGDGKPDGCIIMREMSLHLNSEDGNVFKGVVQEAGSTETISFASVQIQFADSAVENTMTDIDGIFRFNTHSKILHLTLSFVGYRKLNIDLGNSNIIEQ